MILMIPLTMMVAASMMRKPKSTESILDLADSFASALTGRTIINPIHTRTPIAMILVTICIRLTIVPVKIRKSDFDLLTSRFTLDFVCIPIDGTQFLNSNFGLPPAKVQLSAKQNICDRVSMPKTKNEAIYFIDLETDMNDKIDQKIGKWHQGKANNYIGKSFETC